MRTSIAACLLLALVAASSAVVLGSASASASVVQQLRGSQFTGFLSLLEHADLLPEVEAASQSAQGLTVFAPTDEALLYNTSPTLLAFLKAQENRATLRQVLLSHFVAEKLSPFQWEGKKATLCGSHVPLSMDAQAFYAGEVAVQQYNALVGHGAAVHSVPALLIPDELAQHPSLLLEKSSLSRRGLMAAGGPAPAPAPAPAGGNMGNAPSNGAVAQSVASVFAVVAALAVAALC